MTHKNLFAAIGASALLAIPASALIAQTQPAPAATMALPESGVYQIDPGHSQVRASWNHMGLSNPGATIEDVQGSITVDADNPANSSASVTMKVRSIDSGVDKLDEEFYGPAYFDAASHPDISFKSTSLKRTGLGNRFQLNGDLTIKGITKPVTLDAVLNGAGQHPLYKAPALGFSAHTTVRRSDFELGQYSQFVSDELDISITVEALNKSK